jgi:hypothetical protein
VLVGAACMWWPRVGLATVRAELGHLQRLACVSITGVVSMTLMAAPRVLLGLSFLHLVAEAEARALAYRLRGVGFWFGQDSDISHKS